MKIHLIGKAVLVAIVIAGAIANAQQIPSEQPPINVQGKWTIYSRGPAGTDTQRVEFQQEGSVLNGHFKGPHWSGGIEGEIHEHHIVFRTKSEFRHVFRGRVDGDRMKGTFHVRRGDGEWEAVRDQN